MATFICINCRTLSTDSVQDDDPERYCQCWCSFTNVRRDAGDAYNICRTCYAAHSPKVECPFCDVCCCQEMEGELYDERCQVCKELCWHLSPFEPNGEKMCCQCYDEIHVETKLDL